MNYCIAASCQLIQLPISPIVPLHAEYFSVGAHYLPYQNFA